MQHTYGVSLKVLCNTADVLETLRLNRNRHAQILQEAQKGYIEQAKGALTKRLQEFEDGSSPNLIFNLPKPEGRVSAYDTIIKMLELHVDENIELGANEVSQFIEDKWDWSDQFLLLNSQYSASASSLLNSR